MTLGFLGTGAITSAIVTGLCTEGESGYSIRLSPRNADAAAGLAARFPAVSVAASNQRVLDETETVFLAVRPPVAESVLSELRFRADHHVISLMSGFAVRRVEALVAPARTVCRAVPLPSTAKRRCPTAIYPADPIATEVFGKLGAAFAVDGEREFDAFCTATATMATYFAFADGVAGWLSRNGIPETQARDYVARIFAGLANTAVELPGHSFQALATDHATPGGINEQVVRELTRHGVFSTLSAELDAVMRRVTAASR